MLHSYVTDMAARVMPTIQIPIFLLVVNTTFFESTFIYLFILFIYFSPSTRVHVIPFTGGLLLLLKATGAAREPTPRPFTTVGEPIPRTGRHWELNPVPLDLQTSALPTELTGRLCPIIASLNNTKNKNKNSCPFLNNLIFLHCAI